MKIYVRVLIISGLLMSSGSAFAQAGAPEPDASSQIAIELYYNGDYENLNLIDRCAETVPACAAVKGEGLIYGEGWEEDLSAGLDLLTRAAEAGNTEAMTSLYYLYDDDSDPELHNPPLAAKWAGLAATTEADPATRDLNAVEFFTQDFEQARLFDGWTTIQLPVPVHRSFSVMGEGLTQPPTLEADQFEALRRAQRALNSGTLTDADAYLIMKMTSEKYGAAMYAYSAMLRKGIVVPQDIAAADAFEEAAPTWKSQ